MFKTVSHWLDLSSTPGRPCVTGSPLSIKIQRRGFDGARRKYRPSKVRLLLIAESPPSSGGFFYFSTTIGKDHLFRETMKTLGLWPLDLPMGRGVDKRPMLHRFRSLGCYLLDTCVLPVDKLDPAARRAAVLNGLDRLTGDVHTADPANIVIVKSSIFNPVNAALDRAGFGTRVLNESPVPFPSHGNQEKYRRMMKKLLGLAGLL